MLGEVQTEAFRVRGVSLGGVYTSIHIPELSVLFDAGIPMRSAASADHIFLSHGHTDHIGALSAQLGIRGLIGKKRPPRVYLPEQILEPVLESLRHMTVMQRYDLSIDAVPMKPGDTASVRGDLEVRAFATHHVVPSLGYTLVRKIKKLRPEYLGLEGNEIAERKRAGEDLFRTEDRQELSYCTDTLIQALDHSPDLFRSRVLLMECTFLDDRKSLQACRAGCHVHLDEVLERAEKFKNDALVLMHFSQLYQPAEVRRILEERCPEELFQRILPLLPQSGHWPG